MTAVFFLVLVAVLEIFVVVRVAEAIRVGLTLLLLIITTPLGWRLMRSQGRAADAQPGAERGAALRRGGRRASRARPRSARRRAHLPRRDAPGDPRVHH